MLARGKPRLPRPNLEIYRLFKSPKRDKSNHATNRLIAVPRGRVCVVVVSLPLGGRNLAPAQPS